MTDRQDTHHNHDCRHLLGSLSAYVDGEAEAALCAEIEAHMAGCENCRVVVDTLHKTVELYRTLPQPDLPTGLRERLYASLDLQNYLDQADS